MELNKDTVRSWWRYVEPEETKCLFWKDVIVTIGPKKSKEWKEYWFGKHGALFEEYKETGEWFIHYDEMVDWEQILMDIGAYRSKSEARKSGYGGPIKPGHSMKERRKLNNWWKVQVVDNINGEDWYVRREDRK